MRAGTKSNPIRRTVQEAIVSRYAAGDLEKFAAHPWKLVPLNLDLSAATLSRRFGLSTLEAAASSRALTRIESNVAGRSIKRNYLVPLWNWEDAPFLSESKKAQLKKLTATFLRSVSKGQTASPYVVHDAMAAWVQISGLDRDIENYIRPAPKLAQDLDQLMKFKPTRAGPVDPNQVDLGIEFTARYPIKPVTEMTDQLRSPTGARFWMQTYYDLSPDERRDVLKKLANEVGKRASGGSTAYEVEPLDEGDHGHDLVMGYEVKDTQNRSWRIEWDGVGREYEASGTLIPGSGRGGHIEIVTPKHTPTQAELHAVFGSFEKVGLVPSLKAGGGHINVDLAPFEGKPHEMARFLTEFHENRGILSLMFQSPGRLRSGEPLEISRNLADRLRDFHGTEEELKQLLYNERYFNTRLGRKTQYNQLNMNAYFQDVIPPEFLHSDFDIKNDPWRRNFLVDPGTRKAEFRLFNAARDEREAALQIKLVRAMLDKALNDHAPLSGLAQAVDHEAYLRNPEKAERDFQKLMTKLHLDPEEYRPFLLQGLNDTRLAVESQYYVPLTEALKPYPKQAGWGRAVASRSPMQALNSEERPWSGTEDDPAALKRKSAMTELRRRADTERAGPRPPGPIDRTANPLEGRSIEELVANLTSEDLVRVLYEYETHPEAQDREALMRVLEEKKAAGSLRPGLVPAFEHAPDELPYKRWILVQAENAGVLQVVVEKALGDSSEEIRAIAYRHLGNVLDYDGASTLGRLMRVENNVNVVTDAIRQVARLNFARMDANNTGLLVSGLRQVLENPLMDQDAEESLIRAVVHLPEVERGQMLRTMLLNPLEQRRHLAASAILTSEDTGLLETLASFVSSEDPVMKAKGLSAERKLNGEILLAEDLGTDVASPELRRDSQGRLRDAHGRFASTGPRAQGEGSPVGEACVTDVLADMVQP
jgi:hypothetical protein